MDPFDIMLNPDQVIPFYQPVVSADTQLVIGYEVMAYFQDTEGQMQNIDWFFNDSSIPDDFRLELNNIILQKTMDYYMQTDLTKTLFITYDSKLLSIDHGEELLNFLQSFSDKGLILKNIVIQLKEDFPAKEINAIRNIFTYWKSLGIRIALDGVGEKNGNLDRLAYLKPNIVKLNVDFLKDNELPHLYRDVHHSLSLLSRKIGASLMFKEISSYNQLNYAWRNGGRYYQGIYLKKEQNHFVEPTSCKEKIVKDFQLFVNYERKKVKAQLNEMNKMHQQFKTTLSTIKPDDPYDHIILKVGEACSSYAFRVYICNDEGLQLSSNAEKNKEGKWILRQEGKQKNWSWRPYFFENIARMTVEKKGILSDLYTDIERDEQIRTFSYPLSNDLYIFLDIPYAYLYEQEGLL